ncbi:MAG: C69 family dipeptidase [Anaerolineaceae bacterium]|nr:C69 family dipeptidase [Anaerolineaceae bacterium]
MCDSFVALHTSTKDKSVILAKSADCQINEAHALLHIPHQKHPKGEAVRVTHILIPQAEETYEVILSKSFWTYGAEIGINEHGLAIGNEAVYTVVQNEEKGDGIIGIDFLRLALERARSCREAIDVIGALLKQFGQGGNCEIGGNSHFDINYLLADPSEAWVLETAGREWAARQVKEIGSISNAFIIGQDWDRSSLEGQPERVDWGSKYGDREYIPKLGTRERQSTTFGCLAAVPGQATVQTFFNTLRDHGELTDPSAGEVLKNICAHTGPSPIRQWQATGAMVAHIRGDDKMAWVTGTSGTCLSIFKPVFLGMPLPDIGPSPTEHFNPQCMWWEHELLHRRAMADFEHILPEIRAEFDQLESEFLAESESVRCASVLVKKEFMDYCFQRARYATRVWIDRLETRKDLHFKRPEIQAMWNSFNSQAGLLGMPA